MIMNCGEVVGNGQANKLGEHPEGIAWGMPDGVIYFVGILFGIPKTTQDRILVLIAHIGGGAADALRTSCGILIAQFTERVVPRPRNEHPGNEVRGPSKREVWRSEGLSSSPILFVVFILIPPFLRFKPPICFL